MKMFSTNSHSKQVHVCPFILGRDSFVKVQSSCLASNLYLFCFVSDSKRPCQRGDPSLPWTPSRSPKYCSRSLHPQCSPVPKTETNKNTHVHTQAHTLMSSLTHSEPKDVLCNLWNLCIWVCQVLRLAFAQAWRGKTISQKPSVCQQYLTELC